MNETTTPVTTATPSNCAAKCETKPIAAAPAPAQPAPQAAPVPATGKAKRARKH